MAGGNGGGRHGGELCLCQPFQGTGGLSVGSRNVHLCEDEPKGQRHRAATARGTGGGTAPARHSQHERLYLIRQSGGRIPDTGQRSFPRTNGLHAGGALPPVRTEVRAVVRHDLDGKIHREARQMTFYLFNSQP